MSSLALDEKAAFMNPTQKGDLLEKKSLALIWNAIEEKRIGVIAEYIKVFQKKGYYSKDRESDIIFDLSIEVWPPGATNYTLLYLIECKNLDHNVPVDDVEEFYAKILQVAGVNVKAVLITPKGLQKGAYNFAKAKGMMVILGESADNYEITLYKTDRTDSIPKIVQMPPASPNDSDEALEKMIDDTIKSALALGVGEIVEQEDHNVDQLSKTDIEKIAIQILNEINPRILKNGEHLFIRSIKEYAKSKYNFDVEVFEGDGKILGKCDFVNEKIMIHKSLEESLRYSFVLAHEIGHLVLHNKIKISQEQYDSFEDSIYNFSTGRHNLENTKHWLEWQANYFAASILLPIAVFKAQFHNIHGSFAAINLDDQPSNIKHFNEIVAKLSAKFYVTKTSIIMRLNDLNMVNYNSRLKSVGQIIGENVDDFFC